MTFKNFEKQFPKLGTLVRQHMKEGAFSFKDSYNNIEYYKLVAIFTWEHTPERHTFWRYIYNGYFEKARKIYPHLFENNIEIKVNGLLI